MQTQQSPIDFHHGSALVRVASHYQTLAEVIFEAVQNALDANATNITVTINQMRRTVSIQDDGDGTSRKKFEEALTSVCYSVKDNNKLGQFGMGLIAPLGKCRMFTFTSTPKSDPKSYVRWTFDTEAIKEQDKIQGIPMATMPDLHFQRDGGSKGAVAWRTRVELVEFTKDRILSRLTEAQLHDGIIERYSAAMRRHNAVIIIRIKSPEGETEVKVMASEHEGRPLPVESFTNKEAGKTTFKIFIANKTANGRRGKIVVGESVKDFRISFAQFAHHAASSDLLDADVVSALNSGIFEGEILTEKAKLDPNRKHFQTNDALLGLCLAIDEWFEKIGQKHIAKLREEQQDDRYQRLGLRSMHFMESLLQQDEMSHLRDVLKSFRVGTITKRHFEPDAKIIGPQPVNTISTQGIVNGTGGDGGGGTGTGDPKVEHPEHIPYSVGGPRGHRRTSVKGNSMGLQFFYENMEGSSKVWDFDNTSGILRFNIRHPLWDTCGNKDDKTLMRFQEHIALQALMLETVPPDWKDRHRQLVDDSLPLTVFWLMQGDELTGRKHGSALTNYHKSKKKAKAGSGK